MKKLILFLFFASGISGLIYEIVWTRIFTLLFGNTTYAISTVLTAFMAGLAAGSFIFGRIADKIQNSDSAIRNPQFAILIKSPLMLYATLELCIGISALLVPPSLSILDSFYISILGDSLPSAFYSNTVRFLISFFILFIPTTLMGGTLPVLSRFFIHKIEELGWNVAIIYAVNTLGAVIGCFMTGYMFIATIGVKNTTLLAVFINIAVGVVAMILALKIGISPSNQESVEGGQGVKGVRGRDKKPLNPRTLIPSNPSLLLFFFGLSGFTSLSYEILWTRAFSLTFYSTVYLFSNILTVFLLGIAIGSFIFMKFINPSSPPFIKGGQGGIDLIRVFGIIEFLIGVCALISIIFFQWLPFGINSISSLFDEMTWQKNILITFIINLFVMFIPTLLMGLTFPLIGRLYTDNLDLLGRKIGNVYSINTIGSIIGSFVSGFILIPFLGVQKGILFISFINLIMGIIIIFKSPAGVSGLKWSGLTSAVIILFAFGKIATAGINMGVGYSINGNIIFSREDVSGTVKVIEDETGRFRTLMVNNYSLATSGDVAVRFGHIPMLLHNKPEDVLVISLGSGITVGAVGQHPVKNIECVEIVPSVRDAAGLFEKENHNILKDPRLRLTIWDGRNYLLMTKHKYDVIISDLFQPDSAGTGNLYSKEHYQNCKDKLKNGGLMAQWLPLYQLSTEDLKVIMATFSKIFPHVTVWYGDINSAKPTLLLLGSESPLNVDMIQLQEKMRQDGVISDIIEKDNPFAFMSFFIMDEKAVSKFTEGAELNIDDKPYIEFSAPKYIWRRSESAVQNFRELSKFRELPALILPTPNSQLITYFKGRGHIIEGRLYHSEGLFDKEIEEYRMAEMENPFDPYLGFAYFELGYEYYTKGMFKDAVSVFERGKAINRNLKEIQFYLAKSYYKLGMQREYEEILRENPEFVKKN
ncbi:MAG: fused MFS/spermidine synthase [Nitrospinae bacterium]|nr:fused MFS/spermidine synthase [Nitrospinota bacterium]